MGGIRLESENIKNLEEFIYAMDECHWFDATRAYESRYVFTSPFETLRRTIIKAFQDGISENEAIELAVNRMIVDVERDSEKEVITNKELEELAKKAKVIAKSIYEKAKNYGISKAIAYSNYIRDYIYVKRKMNFIQRMEERKRGEQNV